ncbi:MAG: hypothetical protein Q4G45_06115 [Actinomycetia bacterium]|nr:hypothetical protein [Actinomycetes bacterium]
MSIFPDFRTVVADFEKLASEWTQRAAELSAAMEAAGGTEEHPEFTLRTAGPTQIVELRFKDAALGASPVQLREKVLDAYARLGVAGNAQQARAAASILGAPEIAVGMRAALPQDMLDRAQAPEDDDPSQGRESGRPQPVAESATVDEVLAWADATVDRELVLSDDPRDLMGDVEGWTLGAVGRFDPSTAQADFDRQIQAVSDAARDLGPQLAALQEQASSRWMEVVVAGSGRLVDLRFHSGFRSATAERLTADFAELYARATQQVTVSMTAALHEHGLGGDDDPTQSFLNRLDQAVSEAAEQTQHRS